MTSSSAAGRCWAIACAAARARAAEAGPLRADIGLELLGEMFGGLILAGLRRALEEGLGIEEASAVAVSVFLHGAASPGATRRLFTTH